jgi:uncharacterized protein YjaG (DUF416 family)
MKTFDESGLRASLGRLDARRLAIFSAACAQRLLPAYQRYRKAVRDENSDDVTNSLDALWADLCGEASLSDADLDNLIDRVQRLVPDEDQAHAASEPYAEDAAATVAYALATRRSGKVDEATWAAQRVYDAIDNYVIRTWFQGKMFSETAVVEHPLIQRELERQARDLALVATKPSLDEARCRAIREMAVSESRSMWTP